VVERLAQIRRQFPGEPKLKIVSFTVDPEADTPEVLAAYGRTHAIDPAGWKLLTGKADDVYKLIRNAFHLGVEQNTGDEAADDGAVVHSTRLVLVGPDMQIRGYYDSNDPEAMRRIVADITRLLSQRAP
jgi:protein SCO1/2